MDLLRSVKSFSIPANTACEVDTHESFVGSCRISKTKLGSLGDPKQSEKVESRGNRDDLRHDLSCYGNENKDTEKHKLSLTQRGI